MDLFWSIYLSDDVHQYYPLFIALWTLIAMLIAIWNLKHSGVLRPRIRLIAGVSIILYALFYALLPFILKKWTVGSISGFALAQILQGPGFILVLGLMMFSDKETHNDFAKSKTGMNQLASVIFISMLILANCYWLYLLAFIK